MGEGEGGGGYDVHGLPSFNHSSPYFVLSHFTTQLSMFHKWPVMFTLSAYMAVCICKILGISYRDHISNKEVKTRIDNAIGPYEDLLTSVKRRKLRWYRHVTQSSGLAKTVLQGTIQGGRQRGRQRKWWEDNVRVDWPWNSMDITLQKAENRKEWRMLVVKSPVVLQQSARLWDRWRWSRICLCASYPF